MVTLVNRAKMGTSTTGTGTITLGSAETGYQSFADAGVSDSDVVRYVIEDGDAWEIGSGTYTATGTTLSRTLDESSTGSLLNLSGSAVVFITAAAEDVFQGELIAENYDGTSTKPSATGTNAVAMGQGSQASGTGAIAIGNESAATQNYSFAAAISGGLSYAGARAGNSIAMGYRATTNNLGSVAIGYTASTSGNYSLALGRDAKTAGTEAVSLGKSYASGTESFAALIDNNTSTYGATDTNSVAIGKFNKSSSPRAVALGYNNVASHSGSIAIGNSVSSTTSNEISIGSDYDTVRISESYTLPTSDGTANQVLSTDGSGAVSFSDAPNPFDLYAENPSTPTAPSATGANAIAFGSNATASGSSAFAFGIALAQGASSFAVNLGNTGSLYKAGGTNSIAMGSLARAPDNHAISIGQNAQTAAANAIALGTNSEASNTYSIALGGRYARTGADYSMATGYWSRSHVVGSKVHASGRFSTWGDAQTGTYVLRSDTTNATAEAMTADNGTASSSNQIVLQNESAISFTGTVVCREDATDGDDYAGWEIKGVIMRQGAAADTSLGVGIVNKLYASSGISAADVALSADTTNGCLKIQVTGVASTNLNWVATVNTSEVINA